MPYGHFDSFFLQGVRNVLKQVDNSIMVLRVRSFGKKTLTSNKKQAICAQEIKIVLKSAQCAKKYNSYHASLRPKAKNPREIKTLRYSNSLKKECFMQKLGVTHAIPQTNFFKHVHFPLPRWVQSSPTAPSSCAPR